MKQTKICLNAMVANESNTILRMLESCYQYIDYWVIQDNGSVDGTQKIIRDFFFSLCFVMPIQLITISGSKFIKNLLINLCKKASSPSLAR